ncbi:pyrroline-5-carboxylate reductase [Uliginosibacterium sp. H1]|uniref:pyrroline-5-carboxylate reductase n=1 Tax=Uliginosibacterium sp. H1 TaxID=3114757 RepID=UPI002E188C4D|nr:pyrroline-5-carboxylate reductase [Uliginosibacterium sp. H1]
MKITFLGGGNMASALIGGLIKQGHSPGDIQVVEREPDGQRRLTEQFGVRCFGQLDEAALACEVLVLAVKPQQMREALAPLVGQLKQQLLLSVAAGLRLGDIAAWLGGYTRLVRSMPNTPALIGRGITGLYAYPDVDATGRAAAQQVLAAVGRCEWVADESLMDAVTAVSGSGPAYVFRFIEALAAAGAAEGLPADVAQRLAIETFAGAALLAAGSPESPATLRERVTSKGGTTAAALESMNAAGIEGLIAAAVKAARLRGAELGDSLAGNGKSA